MRIARRINHLSTYDEIQNSLNCYQEMYRESDKSFALHHFTLCGMINLDDNAPLYLVGLQFIQGHFLR